MKGKKEYFFARITNRSYQWEQLPLYVEERRKAFMINAMDAVNDKFGDFTVPYGSLLGNDEEKGSHVISPAWKPEGISDLMNCKENTVQVLDDGKCIICGKDNPIGFKARFKIDRAHRSATTTVLIPETCQGWKGITHGGILSALLDETCAHACMGAGLKIVISEIRIRYWAPVRDVEWLLVTLREVFVWRFA